MAGFLILAKVVPEQDEEAVETGRYEFRVWPHDVPQAAAILQRSWSLIGAERRSDIYLLTERSAERLVKLHAGNRLEAKRRLHDLEPLQHWTHHRYPMFPLSRPVLRTLAQELGVTSLAPDAGLSPGHLVARIGALTPQVLPMTVRKSRLHFRKGGSRAEICRVAVAGWTRLTLAIEDPDPDRALQALDALNLGDLPNRSYGEVLCRRRLAAAPTSTIPNSAI